MMYSYKIEQAIRAAAILHQGQTRRGAAPYPYVTHLFSVACILGDYTDDEDIISAGLLHDTLEDTDYTPEELERDFGKRVRDIVEGVTEPKLTEEERRGEMNEQWSAKKQGYIDGLANAPEESLLVSAADKIHNMRSVIEEYHGHADRFLADFGGSLDERVSRYQELSDFLNEHVTNDIIKEFNHVFGEYKTFIDHVKEN